MSSSGGNGFHMAKNESSMKGITMNSISPSFFFDHYLEIRLLVALAAIGVTYSLIKTGSAIVDITKSLVSKFGAERSRRLPSIGHGALGAR
jgi:hypothetical protein